MKIKMIVLALALSSGTALAADVTMAGSTAQAVCGGTAGSFTVTPNGTPQFIQVAFQQGCSANVWMSVAEDNTSAWGASGSQKGKFYMIGNTNGGAPRATSTAIPSSGTPTPADHMDTAAALGGGSS